MAVPAGARKSSAGVIVEADWRMMMPIGPPEPPGPPIPSPSPSPRGVQPLRAGPAGRSM